MPEYTKKQGQYLAFIYNYTKINGIPPAEAEVEYYDQMNASQPAGSQNHEGA